MRTNNKLNHLAIIMDGNGRWATKRGMPRLYGHQAGIQSFKRVIKACQELDIKILSVFAFSTENWSRPKEEVDGIMELITNFCEKEMYLAGENGVRITTMGDLSALPEKLKNLLIEIKEKTKNNDKFILNIGINYGGRAEILRAVNLLLEEGKKNVTKEDFERQLYTNFIPDPDLIIRPSGEQRLSNFMLYQSAYSELYFPKIHWPDFNKKTIQKAIKVFSKRNRRFGGLKLEKK